VVRLEQEDQEGQVGWTLEVKADETLGEPRCALAPAPPTLLPVPDEPCCTFARTL